MAQYQVEPATPDHAASCAAIYAHYVDHSWATFELIPPTPEDIADRIQRSQDRHAWLVLRNSRAKDRAGDHIGDVARGDAQRSVVGYAYATPFRPRSAYDWTSEVSIYMHPEQVGRGGGRQLYSALLEVLAGRGIRTVTAGVILPNKASQALHERMGFRRAGVFERVAFRGDRWFDVAWYQREIGAGTDSAPQTPQPPSR